MNDILVGCTGFVGSNLASKHRFSAYYHSTDIQQAFGTQPDILVYAGVRAEMFLANQNPDADLALIREAMENIRQITPKFVVLISTVAVYPQPKLVDENMKLDCDGMTAYGKNRYLLEQWVETQYPSLIVRLPAIYGEKLKKNFLYDYIHYIPALLEVEKYQELCRKAPDLSQYYRDEGNDFYRCRTLSQEETVSLKRTFEHLGFSALNFTDSRSRYQFYPLSHLWDDISLALAHQVKRLNLVTPPVSVADLHIALSGKPFENFLTKPPFDYDIRTCHDGLFGRSDGYIMSLEEELEEIKGFVEAANKEEH